MREQINIADAKKGDILYVEWNGNGKGIIDYTDKNSHRDANYSIGIIISMKYTITNGTMGAENKFYKATEEDKAWLDACRSGYVPLSDMKPITNDSYTLI